VVSGVGQTISGLSPKLTGCKRRSAIAAKSAADSKANGQARRFAIDAARLAAATRAHRVAVLDLAGLSPVTDYFVIASGTSPRQMRTVCEQIVELAAQRGFKCFRTSGHEGESWIVADFIDVVLHLFSDDARQYYDLDNLWGDAKIVPWQE